MDKVLFVGKNGLNVCFFPRAEKEKPEGIRVYLKKHVNVFRKRRTCFFEKAYVFFEQVRRLGKEKKGNGIKKHLNNQSQGN